jgi:hypothetical protein
MKPIRTAGFLLTAAVVIASCSGVDPGPRSAADEEKPNYFCAATASAGFEFLDDQWRTANVSTHRRYEIGPVGPGIPDPSDRQPDETYVLHELGTDVARPCKEVLNHPSSGMPVTDDPVRVIYCRMHPDLVFDFSLIELPTEHPMLRFTFIRRLDPSYTVGKDAGDALLFELLEIGFCLRIMAGESSGPEVGDCVLPSGSTIVTRRDACTELHGQFRE